MSGAGGAESSVLYTVTASYARLFPMSGLGYGSRETSVDTNLAQALRLFLGVSF